MYRDKIWYDDLPNVKLELCETNLRIFFETMHERQMIWKRRFVDNMKAPWTDNEILKESKFTNVFRDLDRSSQWQIQHIILDDSLSLKDLIWKMMVFRSFNNPDTFSFHTNKWKNGIPNYDEYNEAEFRAFIGEVRSSGQNPFTNAYYINSGAAPGQGRDNCYANVVVPTIHKRMDELMNIILKANNPEQIFSYLKTYPSVSDFIAHEHYQDLTYIEKYTNRGKFMKFGQDDFTNVGPGASVGIRLIYPNLTEGNQEPAIYQLRDKAVEWLDKIGEEKNEEFPYVFWDKENQKYIVNNGENMFEYQKSITLHQIEMWLCEFCKYWKITVGKGKQRSRFVPKTKINNFIR